MSKFDEIKLRDKQATYDLKVKQYEEISQALRGSLNPGDKPKLEKQQKELETDIRKLETDIQKLQAKLKAKPADPTEIVVPSAKVAKRQEKDAERLAEAEARAASQPRPTGRLINSLRYRYDAGTPFYGREPEQALIQEYIQRGERLITIHARAGAGKTALASKVLGDLAQHAEPVTGIVALTAGEAHQQVSLDRILSDFGRLLPEGTLSYQASDPTREKVIGLLNALQSGRYVLLLDNFESLLNDDHALQDADLQALLTVVLERGGLTILVTSRFRPRLERTLQAHEHPISLNEGLPAEDALRMLRGLDKTGLLPADDTPLYTLIERVNGFPRALEAAVGLLADSPSVTFDELLQDTALFEGEVTREIVEKALATLPPLYMRVMEALALYKQPVPLAAVEYLLAPYVDWTNIKLRDVLDRLIDRRFASFNAATRRYGLHPLDQNYCEGRIPEGVYNDSRRIDAVAGMKISLGKHSADMMLEDSTPPYTRFALLGRAARYFQTQRKPEKEWKTLADLEPQLSEFQYRLRLDDYDTAASLLLSFDYDSLLLWGHPKMAVTLHEYLLGKIKDLNLQNHHLGNLGNAYHALGELSKAVIHYEQALSITRQIKDKVNEGVHIGNLGLTYSDIGERQKAVDAYQEALLIARHVGDKFSIGRHLGNLGRTLAEADDYEGGYTSLLESLKFADELKDSRMKSFMGAFLAQACLRYGNLSDAQLAIEIARQYDVPDNNHNAAAVHGVIMVRLNDLALAQTAFTKSVTFADALLKHLQAGYDVRYARALSQSGLALITNTPLDEAQADYEAALAQCDAKGVVQRNLRLLEELAKTPNGERLLPLISLLQERL